MRVALILIVYNALKTISIGFERRLEELKIRRIIAISKTTNIVNIG